MRHQADGAPRLPRWQREREPGSPTPSSTATSAGGGSARRSKTSGLDVGPSDRQRLAAWRTEQGAALEGWARFCALAERHGASWRSWPAELRHPDDPAVGRAVASLRDRVAFHAWLQLLVTEQLDAASRSGPRLIQDLAIGVDPGGADAWLWQDLLAPGFSIGAPPDEFEPDGQRWGLPPWMPNRLRDTGYRPLAEILRAAMVSGGGLRIDHVMGLSRLFWVPDGGTPADGVYVRFPGRELLELVALESARAAAVVVGEDLGTVEPGYREALHETGILSTRLVWFEDAPPEEWPRQALAMVTTHDLPTLAGMCLGVDRPAAMWDRLQRLVTAPDQLPAARVAEAVHRRIGASPAVLAAATLEDLLGVVERPNVPGTLDAERPNWSRALPLPVEDIANDGDARRALAALAEGRASGPRIVTPSVPGAGFEPASPFEQRCLRPPCLPIPPSGRGVIVTVTRVRTRTSRPGMALPGGNLSRL